MIVIDTHVWIWWVDGSPRLKGSVRDLLDAEPDVRVSAISLLEIATAVLLNRLTLLPSARDWLRAAQSVASVTVEPLTAAICITSVELPRTFHRDPGDRLIVALARELDADLVTADDKIIK